MTLENIIGQKTAKKNIGKQIIEYLIPLTKKYEPEEHTARIHSEASDIGKFVSRNEVKELLIKSYEKNSGLYKSAQWSDTLDRVTSCISFFIPDMGLEEGVEMIPKLPFIISAYFKGHPGIATGLLLREGATLVPFAGDAYDALTNIYIKKAEEIIERDVKKEIESYLG